MKLGLDILGTAWVLAGGWLTVAIVSPSTLAWVVAFRIGGWL